MRLPKKENGCKSLKHLVNERALTTLGIFAGQSLLCKIVFVFDHVCCIFVLISLDLFSFDCLHLVKDIPVFAVHDCLDGRLLLARPCLPITSLLFLLKTTSPAILLSNDNANLSNLLVTCCPLTPNCSLLKLCLCTSSSALPAAMRASKARKRWKTAIKRRVAGNWLTPSPSQSFCL